MKTTRRFRNQGFEDSVMPGQNLRPAKKRSRSTYVTAHAVRAAIINAIHAWRVRERLSIRAAGPKLGCHPATLAGQQLYTLSLERLIELLERTNQRIEVAITPKSEGSLNPLAGGDHAGTLPALLLTGARDEPQPTDSTVSVPAPRAGAAEGNVSERGLLLLVWSWGR
jgi:hypothetical protein